MVRQTKQTTVPAVSVPAPVVENVVIEAKTSKMPKKAKETKVVESVVPAKVVAPVPVVEQVKATPEVVEITTDVRLVEISKRIQQINHLLSDLKTDFKVLEKSFARDLKVAQKASGRKRKVTNANRQPSGFVKPTLISDELAKFLGKPAGSELARTEVSKEINAYIRTHNLQDKNNGRLIHPDSKLSVLLNIKSGDELTYFNLQRYMKHHFIKTVVATA